MKTEITAFGTSDRKPEYTTKVICNFPLLSVGVCFGCNLTLFVCAIEIKLSQGELFLFFIK